MKEQGVCAYGNPLLNNIRRINNVFTQEVIVVICLKGDGTTENPINAYAQYWTKDGKFIGEIIKS